MRLRAWHIVAWLVIHFIFLGVVTLLAALGVLPGTRQLVPDCTVEAQRQAYSFDFLQCEGYFGWPAAHMLVTFGVALLVGGGSDSGRELWWPWLLSGLAEIAEALLGATLGLTAVFGAGTARAALNNETLAGSLLGDWLFNNLLGVLAATTLKLVVERRRALFTHTWPCIAALACWTLLGLLPTLTLPLDCATACTLNLGLVLLIVAQLVFVLVVLTWAARQHKARPDDDRLYTTRQLRFIGLFWALWILLVGTQNSQPLMPLWLLPAYASWTQPWFAAGLWTLVLGATALVFRKLVQ